MRSFLEQVSFVKAIEACGTGEQWALAVALLREMSTTPIEASATGAGGTKGATVTEAGGPAADGAAQSVSPTVEAYAAAITACGKAGQWEVAVGLLREVTDGDPVLVPLAPDVVLYNAAIEACGKSGQWERALQLLKEIWEVGLSPTVVS
ncbi:unnamed protein product, partial [Hapterophycus canaliculatus]